MTILDNCSECPHNNWIYWSEQSECGKFINPRSQRICKKTGDPIENMEEGFPKNCPLKEVTNDTSKK